MQNLCYWIKWDDSSLQHLAYYFHLKTVTFHQHNQYLVLPFCEGGEEEEREKYHGDPPPALALAQGSW